MESSGLPFSQRLALGVATLGGVGRVPKAPGTFGTLATVPLAVLTQWGGVWVEGVVLGLVMVIGTWAAGEACRILGRKDPKEVVVDEMAGFLLTMIVAPPGWVWLAVGLVLFRLFDIVKPWPVNKLEGLPGGWGIMADDLAAGGLAGLVLMFIVRIWGA